MLSQQDDVLNMSQHHITLKTHTNLYQRPFDFKNTTCDVIGCTGLENLKYVKNIQNKKVCFDLNKNIENTKRKPPHMDVKLDELLKYLLENERRLNWPLCSTIEESHFFCFRGVLTCIGKTPFEYLGRMSEPWRVVVILFKGHIYLCHRFNETQIEQRTNMSEDHMRYCSWGYKFEQYVVSDSPQSEPTPDEPLNEFKEFSLIFKKRLKKHTIVFGAEMDALYCNEGNITSLPTNQTQEILAQYFSDKKFVELKTNKLIRSMWQNKQFNTHKTKRIWLQCYLAGVETVICGFRDDHGIVQELKIYSLRDLISTAINWNPDVMLNFLDAFLTYVKQCLTSEVHRQFGDEGLRNINKLPMIALRLDWTPGMPVHVADDYDYKQDPILTEEFLNKYGSLSSGADHSVVSRENRSSLQGRSNYSPQKKRRVDGTTVDTTSGAAGPAFGHQHSFRPYWPSSRINTMHQRGWAHRDYKYRRSFGSRGMSDRHGGNRRGSFE